MRQVCVYTACGCMYVHVFWVALLGGSVVLPLPRHCMDLGNNLRLQSPESMPGLGSLD